jgi:hypothetical protein
MSPPLSVVIVTYNPRPRILEWVLDSIEGQTLPKSEFEVVVVDNNSDPPLDEEALRQGRSVSIRLVREPRQGNVFARCCGIAAARTDLIVFVDDDTYLARDYLEAAVRIAREHPRIGVFGGICEVVLGAGVPRCKDYLIPRVLPYFGVRNHGPEPITSDADKYGPWESGTGGMVLRREVGMRFVKFVENSPESGRLGRKGHSTLLSCEDSLLARMACRMGYANSYQPSLTFYHYIPASRLRIGYLVRLLYGLGRSSVILERVLGKPLPLSQVDNLLITLRRLLGNFFEHRFSGLVLSAWDLGRFLEVFKQNLRPKAT